jgi:hypothetical protein
MYGMPARLFGLLYTRWKKNAILPALAGRRRTAEEKGKPGFVVFVYFVKNLSIIKRK